MKTINFTWNDEDYKVEMTIDDNEAGFIEVSDDRIQKVFIEKEYRGLGLYTQLLICALNMSGIDSLRSCDRNDNSNPIWEKWIGEELDYTDNCYVCLDDNEKGLFFTKED